MTKPWVKFCGFTQFEDAALAVSLGVTTLGFILHPKSARYLSAAKAGEVVGELRKLNPRVHCVAVMVHGEAATQKAFADSRCDIVQWHGPMAECPIAAPTFFVWRDAPHASVPMRDAVPKQVTHLLLDTYDPQLEGGTGRVGNWPLAAQLAKQWPLILSGGLHSGNVSGAVMAVKPLAVDVASGIESAPGIKDPTKMRAFLAALESAHV